jgi:hypothetical protein
MLTMMFAIGATASQLKPASLRGARKRDEAISAAATHAQLIGDCFAEFTLGLAKGESRGWQ